MGIPEAAPEPVGCRGRLLRAAVWQRGPEGPPGQDQVQRRNRGPRLQRVWLGAGQDAGSASRWVLGIFICWRYINDFIMSLYNYISDIPNMY